MVCDRSRLHENLSNGLQFRLLLGHSDDDRRLEEPSHAGLSVAHFAADHHLLAGDRGRENRTDIGGPAARQHGRADGAPDRHLLLLLPAALLDAGAPLPHRNRVRRIV